MVAPGFLQNPEVQRWLNGLELAWTMLDLKSVNALRKEPSFQPVQVVSEPGSCEPRKPAGSTPSRTARATADGKIEIRLEDGTAIRMGATSAWRRCAVW